MADLIDVGILTFGLRWFPTVLILLCGLRVISISRTLQNQRLMKATKKAGIVLIIFFLARFIGALIDWYLDLSIGIISIIVNYTFWIWLLILLIKQHSFLKSEQVGEQGRERISNAYDVLAATIEEMKQFREKIITEG